MTFRAFVAVDLPSSPALEELLRELQSASEGLKTVRPEQLHLTLKFLGETEEGLVPDIVRVMREACEGVAPFPIRLRGTGAFPSLSRMHVIWVALEGGEPLGEIARRLDEGMEPLGYAREARPWTAHVTLARVKGGKGLEPVRALLDARREEAFGEAVVEEVRLKRSVLTPQGPQYSTVEAVRLRG